MIDIEVAYALPYQQKVLKQRVPVGTNARSAVLACGIDGFFPEIDLAESPLGIFGHLLAHPEQYLLRAGERVEIYRPLSLDPKEIRKRRAAEKRTTKAPAVSSAGAA